MKFTLDAYIQFAQELSQANAVKIVAANNTEGIIQKKFLGEKKIKQKISFTPYVYNRCSAQCKFCSEAIVRNNSSKNEFAVASNYSQKLDEILSNLKDVQIFLSLSGMEPLESLDFLEQVLVSFDKYVANGGKIDTKVIYSNLSAMVDRSRDIIDLVKKYNIDRIETSRHHYNEDKNQEIMSFRANQDIRFNKYYEEAVSKLLQQIAVKMVCVVQQTGVNSISEVEKYIEWCSKIGVKDVVFRELSIINDEQFRKNNTSSYIEKNRVEIYSLLKDLPSSFKLKEIVKGYYYLSFIYTYNDVISVNFEVSDYTEMIKNHTSDIISKLIYYPNADLCMDWNMQQKIL